MRRIAPIAVLLGLLAACTSPRDTLGPAGPNPRSTGLDGQYALFEKSYYDALAHEGCRIRKITGTKPGDRKGEEYKDRNGNPISCNGENINYPDIFRTMADAGFSLVYGNCSDFFNNAGEHQKWIFFGRDIITAAGTLSTGALSLVGASNETLAALSLSTAGAATGFDIYTQNFLFGADNIESVRTLVMNTLSEHRRAVFADPSPFTFSNTVNAILDNQDYCKPAKILALTREAIRKGDVTASRATGLVASATGQSDYTVTQAVGSLVGVKDGGAPLPTRQMAALYWLLLEPHTQGEEAAIQKELALLPKPPPSAAADWAAWYRSVGYPVAEQLRRLSSEGRAALLAQIAGMRAKTPETAAAAAAAGSTGGGGDKHIMMTIR